MNVVQGWKDWLDARIDMRNAATDPGLKKHFQAEIDLAMVTIRAMERDGKKSGGDQSGCKNPKQKQCNPNEEKTRCKDDGKKAKGGSAEHCKKKPADSHCKPSVKSARDADDDCKPSSKPARDADDDCKPSLKPARDADEDCERNEKPAGKRAGAATEKQAPASSVKMRTQNDNSYVHLFSDKAPNRRLTQGESDQVAKQLVTCLMKDFGFTVQQASGIVGNLSHESAGLNPHVNEFGFSGYGANDPRNFGKPADNKYGYGWAQWSYDRKQVYLDYARDRGMDPGSPKCNYSFLVHELRTSESATVGALKRARTADQAAIAFRQVYERAEMPHDSGRLTAARRFCEMFG